MIVRRLLLLLTGALLLSCSSTDARQTGFEPLGERAGKLRGDLDPGVLVREIGGRTGQLADRAKSGVSELHRVPHIADGVRRSDLSPTQAGARITHAAARVPTALGLDRQPLAGPSDPGAITTAFDDQPREGWATRLARRLPW